MYGEILREHLALVERHAAEGEKHLERQRQILAGLQRGGHETEKAERLLLIFERTQSLHLAELARIREELERAG